MVDYTPEDSGSIVNPQGTAANTNVSGTAEFQADFQSRLSALVQASLSSRPDSISLDYLTAFCLGPVANADTSLGAISHVWRCRVDNVLKKIYITRENDTKDGWDIETELFSFDDGLANINEVDIAFEQAGRPVICAERNTGLDGTKEVWLYWFDTTDSTFGFDNFGAGRTPRVILDSPLNITDSDVLFFYLTTSALVYRQQRDRYTVEIDTGFVVDSNTYIEDVVKLRDTRLKIELIQRNPTTGTFTVKGLTSTLYPIIIDSDGNDSNSEFVSATLIIVVIDVSANFDEADYSSAFISGTLVLPLIDITLFDIDSNDYVSTFVSGTLLTSIIDEILKDMATVDYSSTFVSGTMIVIVVANTLYDTANMDYTSTFVSGTLEIV